MIMFRIGRRLLSNMTPIRHITTNESKIYTLIEKTRIDMLKHMKNRNKIVIVGVTTVTLIGIGSGYIYYDNIKRYLTSESTDVAKNTIKDPEFQQHAVDLSSDTVAQLCQDPIIQKKLTELLVIAINTDEVKNAAINMVHEVLRNPDIKKETSQMLGDVLSTQYVKDNTQNTLSDIIDDDQFKEKVSTSLYDVITKAMTPSIFKSEASK